MGVIENISEAARKIVRDAAANPAGTVKGSGARFREAHTAGYLVSVPGAIDTWRITLKGREFCLKLMRVH